MQALSESRTSNYRTAREIVGKVDDLDRGHKRGVPRVEGVRDKLLVIACLIGKVILRGGIIRDGSNVLSLSVLDDSTAPRGPATISSMPCKYSPV